MNRIDTHGRIVYPVTSEAGQRDYYEHLNYWRVCYANTNPLVVPSREEALEYLSLLAEKKSFLFDKAKESHEKYRRLEAYNTRYDWRPQKSGDDKFVGLISPTGERLLPDSFADVFTQFDAINHKPIFVPVSNGEAWALVSLSEPHILMTDFQYDAIIPERWGHRLFFVQDRETKKWGALEIAYPIIHNGRLPLLKILMPPIADEIYEDELMTEDEPTTFFMTRRGEKIGILTDFGYSDIIYDSYEADDTKCTFRLLRNDRKRARRVTLWHPDGNGQPAPLRRHRRTR